MKVKNRNHFRLYILVILLGAVTGAVLWGFLKAVGVCTELLWEILPRSSGIKYMPAIFCTAGGFAAGLIRRKYGDYPEELPVVLGKIKRNRHYDYQPMPVMLICAFLPLILGASVGPEAGLTGIIAGLCYWVGDNVKYAREHAEEYSEIGAAVTLSGLFHIPLFGIFAVEESMAGEDNVSSAMPKAEKLLLYGLSIAAAFLMMKGLGWFFGPAGEGFPSFESADAGGIDLALMPLYIPTGIVLFIAFSFAEKLTKTVSDKLPPVVRETICGLAIGLVALITPGILFSGEEYMGMLPETFISSVPYAMIGICILKIFMTAFCIEFGLKGGHFFPLIYACSCMGFGLALLLFSGSDPAVMTDHAVFAAAVITAATLGAQLKKPLAVSMLLMICFPLKLILWIFVSAAIGSKVKKTNSASSGSV